MKTEYQEWEEERQRVADGRRFETRAWWLVAVGFIMAGLLLKWYGLVALKGFGL